MEKADLQGITFYYTDKYHNFSITEIRGALWARNVTEIRGVFFALKGSKKYFCILSISSHTESYIVLVF